MNDESFFNRVDIIIKKGVELARTVYPGRLVVDFVDVFAGSEEEYKELCAFLITIGRIVDKSPTGNAVLLKNPHKTSYSVLKLVKVRVYDEKKGKYLGAPDFRVDYADFKEKYGKHCNLIKRESYEMLELVGEDVLVYFPSETLSSFLNV